MKRLITLLLTITIMLSFMLTSCGEDATVCTKHVDADKNEVCDDCGAKVPFVPSYLGVNGIYNPDFDWEIESTVYPAASIKSSLIGLTVDSTAKELVLFKSNSADDSNVKYAVFNAKTGNVVYRINWEYSYSNSETTVELLNENDSLFKTVTKDTSNSEETVYTTKIFTALGNKITEKSGTESGIEIEHIINGLYVINDKAYMIKDDVASFKFDVQFKKLPDNITHFTENNYYTVQNGKVFVYDTEFNLLSHYAIPSDCNEVYEGILANGNVIIQYKRELPADATNYHLYKDEVKYNVYSVIFNVKSGTAKNVELGYLIYDVSNAAMAPESFGDYIISSDVKNIAYVTSITDKMLDKNNQKILSVDNDMKTVGYLGQEIIAQKDLPIPLGNKRFAATAKDSRTYLINEKGEVIGEISSLKYDFINKLLYDEDGKFYDLYLDLVFDKESIEYNYLGGGFNYEIYSEPTYPSSAVNNYYILVGTNIKSLSIPANANGFAFYSNYFSYNYSTTDGRNYIVYCNTQGESIYSVDVSASIYVSHNVTVAGESIIISSTTRSSGRNSYKNFIATDSN